MLVSNIRLLIIDEKLGNYTAFRQRYQSSYAFEVTSDTERGLGKIASEKPDMVILGLHPEGLYNPQQLLNNYLPRALKLLKGTVPLVVFTSNDASEWGSKFIKKGAFACFPFQNDAEELHLEIQRILLSFKHDAHTSGSKQNQQIPEPDAFLVHSSKMQDIKARLEKLAEYPDTNLLILGESGVGKEVATRHLHQVKKNGTNLPFEAINLSVYTESLLFSEIFGHKKGSFTGATNDKEGAFEKAKQGTLFLDEIGDISLQAQVALLRVIQERSYRRVGDSDDRPLLAQMVFATNKNLKEEIAQKRFREDLFHRINDYTIHIPPLRERPEEILPFLDHFWDELCTKPDHFMHGLKGREVFSPEALEYLLQYDWPGNIRELRSIVQKIIIDADLRGKREVDKSLLPVRLLQAQASFSGNSSRSDSKEKSPKLASEIQADVEWPLAKQTAFAELKQVESILRDSAGRKEEAAQTLGLNNDQNLRYLIRKYFKKYPDILSNFPVICKLYKLKI